MSAGRREQHPKRRVGVAVAVGHHPPAGGRLNSVLAGSLAGQRHRRDRRCRTAPYPGGTSISSGLACGSCRRSRSVSFWVSPGPPILKPPRWRRCAPAAKLAEAASQPATALPRPRPPAGQDPDLHAVSRLQSRIVGTIATSASTAAAKLAVLTDLQVAGDQRANCDQVAHAGRHPRPHPDARASDALRAAADEDDSALGRRFEWNVDSSS